jgi:endonuclease YncB( thermonuclease family)
MTHRQYPVILGLFLIVAALVLVPSLTFTQRVERIVDGDTLVVSGLGTVRLIGVDTPESVDPRRPVEAYGQEATQFLTNLALGKIVKPEFDVTRTVGGRQEPRKSGLKSAAVQGRRGEGYEARRAF